jgi:hypothetical protein
VGQAVPTAAVAPAAPVSEKPPEYHDRSRFQLRWREPSSRERAASFAQFAAAQDNSKDGESLEEAIQRIANSQQAKTQERRKNRLAGFWAVLAGLGFLAAGAFLIWFTNALGGGRRIVVPTGVLLTGLAITVAGLHAMVTGEGTIAVNGELAWEIHIGPEGISRAPASCIGYSAMVDGRIYYWHGIDHLEYEEDFTFGTGRTLILHLANGSRERIGIANEVTPERLAETAAAWGKCLEVTGAGDWKSTP